MRTFDPATAKDRLVELVRERAYRDGLDIVLVSGKRSDFYINGKKVKSRSLGGMSQMIDEALKKGS